MTNPRKYTVHPRWRGEQQNRPVSGCVDDLAGRYQVANGRRETGYLRILAGFWNGMEVAV